MNLNSKIIIGCMSWGKWGKQFSIDEQVDMIEFCLEKGNSVFDHADLYGDYTTESEFGKALKKGGFKREEISIITKCGIQNPGKTRNNSIKHYNYSKDYIIWSAENSLKNLNTDYLDVFLLHRPSPLMNPLEIAEAISILKDEGKIINFGVSNFTAEQVDLIKAEVPVSVNQIEFSLINNSAMINGNLAHMQNNNIQPMAWGPLGKYFTEDNEQTKRIKKELLHLSKKYDVSEDTILLSWIVKHPSKISPVVGTTNKQRIIQANKALKLQLELEDWFSLWQAALGREVD